jgi:undecaprenyl-diphosphatase
MDPLLLLKAAILGVVEGLTEFLPVSSTGHLILVATLLDFHDARGRLFEIVIQSGAILAVIWEFRARLGATLAGAHRDPRARRLLLNVAIAFVPLAALGMLFGEALKAGLFNAPTVATAFIVGGLVILWAERRNHHVRVHSVDDMTVLDALKVGIAQAFALVPGTSRSGATIIGGMLFGLSRQVATEFTFYLAIPTLGIASLYSLYKERALLSVDDLGIWIVGLVSAFVSAFACVRWLLRYVATHTFVPFAWYRIAFGVLVLLTAWSGLVDWST